ncbi:MAG: cytochrome c peroxidase [Bacteroidota bacterium]
MRLPKVASEPVLPSTPYNYDNPDDPTNNLATLGRVLFYDKALSSSNNVSCASCHKQSLSFSDDQRLSPGVNNLQTTRNTLPIQNLTPITFVGADSSSNSGYGAAEGGAMNVTIGGLFWDGREGDLRRMVIMPLENPNEMGSGLSITKLLKLPYYKLLFQNAFGYEYIEPDQVASALTAFVLSLKTPNTRFDQYRIAVNNGQTGNNILSEQEIKGMQLFEGKYNCNNCHQVENASRSVPRFANIGLAPYADQGLANITGNVADEGKFRVPSLRNVEFTAPYMHDGSLLTLESVIKHYSDGIVDHPNLHPDLLDENNHARKMNISAEDTQALIAFLLTLSDKSITNDPKFSDPFREN